MKTIKECNTKLKAIDKEIQELNNQIEKLDQKRSKLIESYQKVAAEKDELEFDKYTSTGIYWLDNSPGFGYNGTVKTLFEVLEIKKPYIVVREYQLREDDEDYYTIVRTYQTSSLNRFYKTATKISKAEFEKIRAEMFKS